MNSNLKHAQDLLDFIDNSPSPYHVVNNLKNKLLKNDFSELNLKDRWKIEKGGKYFVCQNDTSLFAFKIGAAEIEKSGFKIVAAHSDSPTFKNKTFSRNFS